MIAAPSKSSGRPTIGPSESAKAQAGALIRRLYEHVDRAEGKSPKLTKLIIDLKEELDKTESEQAFVPLLLRLAQILETEETSGELATTLHELNAVGTTMYESAHTTSPLLTADNGVPVRSLEDLEKLAVERKKSKQELSVEQLITLFTSEVNDEEVTKCYVEIGGYPINALKLREILVRMVENKIRKAKAKKNSATEEPEAPVTPSRLLAMPPPAPSLDELATTTEHSVVAAISAAPVPNFRRIDTEEIKIEVRILDDFPIKTADIIAFLKAVGERTATSEPIIAEGVRFPAWMRKFLSESVRPISRSAISGSYEAIVTEKVAASTDVQAVIVTPVPSDGGTDIDSTVPTVVVVPTPTKVEEPEDYRALADVLKALTDLGKTSTEQVGRLADSALIQDYINTQRTEAFRVYLTTLGEELERQGNLAQQEAALAREFRSEMLRRLQVPTEVSKSQRGPASIGAIKLIIVSAIAAALGYFAEANLGNDAGRQNAGVVGAPNTQLDRK